MIKNSQNSNKTKSAKGNANVRMGGSPGGKSAKGIKHGVGGRQLDETEHQERMGQGCGDGYAN